MTKPTHPQIETTEAGSEEHHVELPAKPIQHDERKAGPERRSASIVAIIPAFNEERFIASVVLKTRRYTNTIIVVDDGSSDRTAELAAVVGAEVVRQPTNLGKAEALNAGFHAARKHQPDVVVCLDADAQHDPADIPNLTAPILSGETDIVIGSRFLSKKSKIPGWRQFGQHTLTAVTNITSGVHITDSQSGFRAFSPRSMDILRFRTGGLSVESEMQFLVKKAGLSIQEVPISVSYLDGNKRNPVVHAVQIFESILSLVARRRPLLFFALPGLAIGCLGLLLGSQVVFTMQRTGELLIGSAILTTLLLIGGLLFAVAGVMLHSVQHIIKRLQEEIRDAVTLIKPHNGKPEA